MNLYKGRTQAEALAAGPRVAIKVRAVSTRFLQSTLLKIEKRLIGPTKASKQE